MQYHPDSLTITFEAAIRDLESRTPKARARAAHALGDVTDPEERRTAADALLTALRDDRQEVRIEAALSLGDLALEAAVPGLVGRLDDGVPGVRQAAAIALGKLGFRTGFDALAEALQTATPDLRFQAATSLAEIDPEAAYDRLIAALADDDPEVLSAVALSLGCIEDQRAVGHLSRLLDHKNSQTRFDAAFAMACLGDGRAGKVLVDYASHKTLGWDAIEALERLRHEDAVDAIAHNLDRKFLLKPINVRAAGAVLVLAPAGEHATRAKTTLRAALASRKLPILGLAVEMLARIGSSWAAGELRSLRATRKGKKMAEEIDEALAIIAKGSE